MEKQRYIRISAALAITVVAALGLSIPSGSLLAAASFDESAPADGAVRRAAELPAMAASQPRVFTAGGIRITLHDEQLLRSRLSTLGGEPIIQLDAQRYVTVITDINDPQIYNRGDGSFHPFPEQLVIDALQAVSHPGSRFDVTVYILPYPRRQILVSSTSGHEIFLSPHVLDIHPAVAAYIVAHELGHVFHHCYMPEDSRHWDDYRLVRGITDTARFNNMASHPYRPNEIFAEDFRVLFGGDMAAYGGNIENAELATPLSVDGLRAFFLTLGGLPVRSKPEVLATSYPNPFNPETEIHVTVPIEIASSGEPISVRIYNVRGALVRELFSGRAGSGELQLRWDGTDQHGHRVASANYYAQIRAGGAKTSLKLVMLK